MVRKTGKTGVFLLTLLAVGIQAQVPGSQNTTAPSVAEANPAPPVDLKPASNVTRDQDQAQPQEVSIPKPIPVPIPIDPVLPPIEPPLPPKEEYIQCGTNLTGNSGRFSTHNFPEPYQPRSNCTWNITVDEGKRVKLTFYLFNVEENPNCMWDYVKVYDSNGTLLKFFCGLIQQELVIFSTGNKLGLHFFTDGVIETAGFLASWEATTEDATTSLTGNDEGYLLAFPQTFTTSTEALSEDVCLQMFNVNEPGSVDVRIFNSKDIVNGSASVVSTFKHASGDAEVHCQRIKLPANFEAGSAIVQVEGKFDGSDYKILSYKSVRALKLSPMILVQTDKSDYRPKQSVKFRVLLLNYELKPSVIGNVKEIWITNPLDSRLAQWSTVELKKGIAQREFLLPDEPALGEWKIHVKHLNESDDETLATFTVSENVLPKFAVTVEPPKVVLFDSNEETFKVCATYTHGGKVKGNANVTFFAEFQENYWRAPKHRVSINKPENALVDGCVKVKLNNSEIIALALKEVPIQVLAVIKEAVTGTHQNTTEKLEVHNTPFVIDASSSATDHIIGGFPYVGKVKVSSHDGTALEGVNLEVCARLFTSLEELRDFVSPNSYKLYSYTEDEYLKLAERISKLRYLEVCEQHRTKADGTFKFSVPIFDVPANVSKLSLKFVAVDNPANETSKMLQPEAKLDVSLTHSNATSALTIFTKDKPEMRCEANSVKIFFAAEPNSKVELSYYVSSGGAILASGHDSIPVGSQNLESEFVNDATVINLHQGEKKPGTIVGSHVIELTRPFVDEGKVAKTIKVLVFARDANNTGISATREFTAASCASQPTVKWSAEKLNPGDSVKLSFEGQSGAFCGYSIVDKSVDLVPNANKITVPRILELKEAVTQTRITNDVNQGERCQNANLLFQAFERLGLFVMSDQLKIDAKCGKLIDATNHKTEENPQFLPQPVALQEEADFDAAPQAFHRGPAVAFAAAPPSTTSANKVAFAQFASDNEFAGSGGGQSATVAKNKVELRNYFPETWLFDMIDLDVSGKAYIDVKAPHTITTWVAGVVCSHEVSGLGISNSSSLLVTQDFFADINIPYSVKRGEVLPVNISVFNSVEKRLPMKLTIKSSDAYTIDQPTQDVCLSAKDNDIKTFNVTAKELHEVNITVEAKITDTVTVTPACEAAGAAEGYTDVLQKAIQVKPEGFPVEKVQSIFQCRTPADKKEDIKLDALVLPDNLVDGSDRAWVLVSGDIMAPALANLDKLVTLPTGCGEQNMITMAPNVYLMDYLNGTGKKKPELEAKAKKHMVTGFENEQKFRHPNGAYSIWGPKQDKMGSMWLSSFVLKVFSQATRFITIDSNNMQGTIDFILANQLDSGCFNATGYVMHSDLAGTDQSITASVLIALLEVKQNKVDVTVDETIINKALKCINSNITKDTEVYTKSLSTYALSLYNKLRKDIDPALQEAAQAGDFLKQLIASANTSVPGQLYWTSGKEDHRSRSVEITAYNVLSLVLHDRLPEALQAIRWLAAQRNSVGGFVSTQDTMVALQAMSQYSLKISESKNDLNVKATEKEANATHEFALNEDNKLLLQQQKLTKLPSVLAVDVSGEGCFMVQTVLRYNVKESPEQKSFTVRASQKDEKELQVCASYIGSKAKTDMVVVEVELLSGFVADRDSLLDLENEVEAPVKKSEYDEEKGEVVLYLDGMPKKEACWTIEVSRKVRVGELKPAIVKVYDYYNTEDVFSTQYNLA